MSYQLNTRSSGRTTMTLRPATERVRMCSKHPDRKAIRIRAVQLSKPVPQFVYTPECSECAERKRKDAVKELSLAV